MTTKESGVKTPLYNAHISLGARMVDFHGFLMPIQYTGIIDEHNCVRTHAGIFDISHMGVVEVRGTGALPYLQQLVTNDVGRLNDGEAQYTPICNEQGGIIDDVIVYRLDKDKFILVINSSNVTKDLEWMLKIRHLPGGKEHAEQSVEIINKNDETAVLAIQGPSSEPIMSEITGNDISQLGKFHIKEFTINNTSVLISRTGYTGEDGFEIFVHPEHAEKTWESLISVGRNHGLKPIGLGARDTLRLEAGLLLYGNDIDENTTPLEAGIGWTVSFDKDNFIGRDKLLAQKSNQVDRKLIGFVMVERGIPRTGFPITVGTGGGPSASIIGKVTSGTFSPSTKRNIGLGYVDTEYSPTGTHIGVKIRENIYTAVVVKTPFYRR